MPSRPWKKGRHTCAVGPVLAEGLGHQGGSRATIQEGVPSQEENRLHRLMDTKIIIISLKIQQCRWNWPSPWKTQLPKLIQEETDHQHSPTSTKERDCLVKSLLVKLWVIRSSLVNNDKCLRIISRLTLSLPQHRKETDCRKPVQHCSNMETRDNTR